jgi:hypothetical protein
MNKLYDDKYFQKYQKYKEKYINLKAGAMLLHHEKIMPGLSYGTAQGNSSSIKKNIKLALENGYKHIDIKQRYASMLRVSESTYLKYIKEAIEESYIPREELWITWHGFSNIEEIIEQLNCQYIDTVIVNNNIDYLIEKKEEGLIKNIAVENIYNFEKIKELHELYKINTLQIQAHIKNDELIQQCNEIGIKVQLYGINSALTNLEEYPSETDDYYYLMKYITIYYMLKFLSTGNVIIVGSYSGSSIPINIKNYQDILNGTFDKSTVDIEKIERLLLEIGNELPDMGFGTLYKK